MASQRPKLFAEITAVPATLQGSHFVSLDGLRGISILMVIFHHYGLNHYLRPYGLFIESDTGVRIFFVLSGFLITTVLLKEKLANGHISLKYLYLRRALRILPVAYLFLLVLIVLNAYYSLHVRPIDFIASFLFFKNLPLKQEPFTAHFWSLAVEEQFYLIFPWLLSYNTNKYFVLTGALVIAVPIVCLLGYYEPGLLTIHPLLTWPLKAVMYFFWKGPFMILIGSVFALLTFKGTVGPIRAMKSFFLAFVLLGLVIMIQARTSIFYFKYISEYVSAIIIGYVIVLSINPGNFLSAILSNRLLVWIGILSYTSGSNCLLASMFGSPG
jgi:peptidoglycan/LPS O-acetylase OafA/YrhL